MCHSQWRCPIQQTHDPTNALAQSIGSTQVEVPRREMVSPSRQTGLAPSSPREVHVHSFLSRFVRALGVASHPWEKDTVTLPFALLAYTTASSAPVSQSSSEICASCICRSEISCACKKFCLWSCREFPNPVLCRSVPARDGLPFATDECCLTVICHVPKAFWFCH